MTIRTRFDGKKILLPKELEGHDPCDVQIVLADAPAGEPAASIWDVVARSRGTRDPETILQESSVQRDEWGHN